MLKCTPFNPISGNPTKWSNTLKQFLDKLLMNSLSVFDHFVKLTLKGLNVISIAIFEPNFLMLQWHIY